MLVVLIGDAAHDTRRALSDLPRPPGIRPGGLEQRPGCGAGSWSPWRTAMPWTACRQQQAVLRVGLDLEPHRGPDPLATTAVNTPPSSRSLTSKVRAAGTRRQPAASWSRSGRSTDLLDGKRRIPAVSATAGWSRTRREPGAEPRAASRRGLQLAARSKSRWPEDMGTTVSPLDWLKAGHDAAPVALLASAYKARWRNYRTLISIACGRGSRSSFRCLAARSSTACTGGEGPTPPSGTRFVSSVRPRRGSITSFQTKAAVRQSRSAAPMRRQTSSPLLPRPSSRDGRSTDLRTGRGLCRSPWPAS